jgi:ArsR family transcriptional regulator
MNNITQYYKALSDENRLRILNLLLEGELCVCKITDVLSMPQSRASRHLASLKNAGLVRDRRDGLWILYSLAPAESDLHKKVLETLDAARALDPVFSQDKKRLKEKLPEVCM